MQGTTKKIYKIGKDDNSAQQIIMQELTSFPTCTLQEIQSASLQSRVDTKFLIRSADLTSLLRVLSSDFSVLKVNGQVVQTYKTLYFDTPTFQFYTDHHNGKRPRYKVRMREYCSSQESFLEIKQKKNIRTNKKRMPIQNLQDEFSSRMEKYIHKNLPFSIDQLQPVLSNTFQRTTLVNLSDLERLTIDTNLTLYDQDQNLRMSYLAIFELKQPMMNRESMAFTTLKDHGYHPVSFSKYCTGIAVFNPDIKKNRFKENIKLFTASIKRNYTYVNFNPLPA